MPQSVFVTGATGFTGLNLCRELLGRGCQVRALVRPESPHGKTLSDWGAEIVTGDLSEHCFSPGWLKGIETVYHTAAVFRKEGVPREYFFDINLGGTKRMVRAALSANVGRFIHCSTVGVLGNVLAPPADEKSPYSPHDHYQHSKTEAEKYVLAAIHKDHLPGVVIRPGAIYGPGDRRLLKLFRAVDRKVFWMVGPGKVHYHLVHVHDLVNGLILAAERKAALGEIFILAGAESIQIWHLVELIANALNRTVGKRSLPAGPALFMARAVEKVSRWAGIEPFVYPRRLDFFLMNRSFTIQKARSLLGYCPAYSLEAGIRMTADWYRQNGYL